MSTPSFENIDRWFFEYVEGNLSPQQLEQFKEFLSMNPELEMELEAWDSSKLDADIPVYVAPQLLEKSLNYSYFVIAAFAVFVISGALFLFSDPVASRYVSAQMDLVNISEEDDMTTLVSNINNIQSASHVQHGVMALSTENSVLKETDRRVAADVNGLSELTSSSLAIFSKKQTSQSTAESIRSNTSLPINTYESSFKFGQMFAGHFASPEFPTVRKSLEQRKDVLQLTSVEKVSFQHGSPVASNSGLSRKVKSTFRKIQRMMDQPIALRNSKDAHILVPNMTGFQPNFGMTGTMIQNRFQATSRNQWVGREGHQLMNTLSWDGYVPSVRGGLGVDMIYNDYQAGGLKTMQVGLTYSPKFSVNKNVSIEPALRFKMGNMALDENSAIIGGLAEFQRGTVRSMFEDQSGPIGSNLWYRDVGAGLLVNTKWFYVGANVDNMARHYNNIYSSELNQDYRESIHFSAITGTEYKALNRDLMLSTYLFYQKFNHLNELWLGANIRWKMLTAGGAVSNNLDVAGSLGLQFDKFAIHYNVDRVSSALTENRMLSHQVSIRALIKPSSQAMRFLNL